jgi:Ca-activated chloride channel family protein
VDPLKYGNNLKQNKNTVELMTVKFRYKNPDEEKSRLIEHPVIDGHIALNRTSDNFRLAAAVAQFGMLLTHSEFRQQSSYNNVLALAHSAIGNDPEGYRKGFIELVKKAGTLAKNEKNNKEGEGLAGRK